MKYKVIIMPKDGIFDPQGNAVKEALEHLGFDNVSSIHQGKIIEIEGTDIQESQVADMCKKLLVNKNTEQYIIETGD